MTVPEYILAFLMIANLITTFFGNARRLQDVERKLNLLLSHLDINPTSRVAPSPHVISLAADPKKRLIAIKAYRLQTGADLKEAAAVIDQLQAGTQRQSHEN